MMLNISCLLRKINLIFNGCPTSTYMIKLTLIPAEASLFSILIASQLRTLTTHCVFSLKHSPKVMICYDLCNICLSSRRDGKPHESEDCFCLPGLVNGRHSGDNGLCEWLFLLRIKPAVPFGMETVCTGVFLCSRPAKCRLKPPLPSNDVL